MSILINQSKMVKACVCGAAGEFTFPELYISRPSNKLTCRRYRTAIVPPSQAQPSDHRAEPLRCCQRHGCKSTRLYSQGRMSANEQVAADLSHIASPAQVSGYLPPDNGAEKALQGCDIVVIPAGVPRKPGMTRDDLFVSCDPYLR